jgi:LuxR family transcriptional regulator, maltose regulon positive regulatory protein
MPKHATNILAWHKNNQTYDLSTSQGNDVLHMVLESPAWVAWLQSISSFAFHGKTGSYTARKEYKARGEGYWYAYARIEGKVTKRYLGPSADLTLAWLEQTAQELPSQRGIEKLSEQVDLAQRPVNPLVRAEPLPADGVERRPSSTLQKLAEPLMATKVHVPRTHAAVIHRLRLVERLQQGMEGTLTLLSAPVGFGKTTLLSTWLSSSATPAAWFSVEPDDNDPVRFYLCLVAALQTIDVHLETNLLPLLQSSQPTSLKTVLALLVNDLSSQELPRFALVLDDYHVITAEPIHHALTFLLEHPPPQMHLFIATRADPPFPLARLRGRGQLTEVRMADLQFVQEEADQFLRTVMNIELSQEESAALQSRTEGWIAGLQLAALALRERTDVSAFLAAFTGTHRFVLDYLSEEVFECQPAPVQAFLLHTCLLKRLCGSLCDAVTGESNGQVMLEQLDSLNLFLVSLDDERQWYRYHHLFAQVLQNRLRRTQPTLLAEVHSRASRWYEQLGYLEEAVDHALAGRDFDQATELIEQFAGPALRSRGIFATIQHWIETVPKERVCTRPQLCLLYAWALLGKGVRQLDVIETWLQDALRALSPDHPSAATLSGEVAAIRSTIARHQEEHTRSIDFSRQALALLPPEHWLRGLLALNQGTIFLKLGDVVAATTALTQASVLCQADGAWQLVLLARSFLADVHVLQGHLRQAALLYQEVLQLADEDGPPLRGVLLAHGGIGDVLRERNELDAALVHLEAGLEVYHAVGGVVGLALAVYIPLARVRQAQGDLDGAYATLADLEEQLVLLSAGRQTAALVAAWQARLHLAQSNLDAAALWAQKCGINSNETLVESIPREVEYMTLVRLLLAQGQTNGVLPLLERLLDEAKAADRGRSVIEVLMLQALAYQAQGMRTHALERLKQALTLAEPEGYIRLFVDEGTPMATLLSLVQEQGLGPRGYLQTLLAAYRDHEHRQGAGTTLTPKSHTPQLHQPLIDPLSEREWEVLRHLAAGASNDEIAEQLVIAVGTAKRHVSNILAKLAVTNRTQAVARAREIGLL